MNFLKGGILFAESIVLPGPRYTHAVQTPTYGCGLDPVLREYAWKLEGISHGWTAPRPSIQNSRPVQPHSSTAPQNAAHAFRTTKRTLQEAIWKAFLGHASTFRTASTGPLIAVETTSMDAECSLELLLESIDSILALDVRIIILGAVQNTDERASLEYAYRKYKQQLLWIPEGTTSLSRQVLAAADAVLFPAPINIDATSLYAALGAGSIPIALACSGLHFLAPDIQARPETGCAFVFYRDHADALVDCIHCVCSTFADEDAWNAIAIRCQHMDVSWQHTASEYTQLYRSLLARSGARNASLAENGRELKWAVATN